MVLCWQIVYYFLCWIEAFFCNFSFWDGVFWIVFISFFFMLIQNILDLGEPRSHHDGWNHTSYSQIPFWSKVDFFVTFCKVSSLIRGRNAASPPIASVTISSSFQKIPFPRDSSISGTPTVLVSQQPPQSRVMSGAIDSIWVVWKGGNTIAFFDIRTLVFEIILMYFFSLWVFLFDRCLHFQFFRLWKKGIQF